MISRQATLSGHPSITRWAGHPSVIYGEERAVNQTFIKHCPRAWSTIWDSNPPQMLGRHRCYHYTNGACIPAQKRHEFFSVCNPREPYEKRKVRGSLFSVALIGLALLSYIPLSTNAPYPSFVVLAGGSLALNPC